jgi:cytoskeletal protein RodZ
MPYVKSKTTVNEINFLASSKVIAHTYQISDVGVTANAQGRKIVPAGTVYPANGATAIGITYTDTDVTEGPQPGSVIIDGWILEARLPAAPTADAKTSLATKSNIKFKQSVGG